MSERTDDARPETEPQQQPAAQWQDPEAEQRARFRRNQIIMGVVIIGILAALYFIAMAIRW